MSGTQDFTFTDNEVYTVDIAMTTGDGKPRDFGVRPTVYRLNPDVRYDVCV